MEEIDKEKAIELWASKLTGEISSEDEWSLNSYIKENPQFEEDLEHNTEIWGKLDKISSPEPGPRMDEAFYDFLSQEIKKSKAGRKAQLQINSWFHMHWRASVAFLLIGLIAGKFLLPDTKKNNEISILAGEVQEMKKMMMLTLIEQPKAQERIRAVSMTSEIKSIDQKVIDALDETLATDSNINVRLAAIESLMRYWDNAAAREALVKNITNQTSPLVQSAIVDAMVSLREKEAIIPLQKLKEDIDVDEGIKEKITNSIDLLQSI